MKRTILLLFLLIIGFSNIEAQNSSIPTTSQNIVISPNPSTDFIKISGLYNEQYFVIYDMIGQEIISGWIKNNETIDIQEFKAGLYMLKLSNRTILKFIKR